MKIMRNTPEHLILEETTDEMIVRRRPALRSDQVIRPRSESAINGWRQAERGMDAEQHGTSG